MNLRTDIGIEGFRAQLNVDAVTFTVLGRPAPALTFDGIINPAPPVEPGMELGGDLRELSIVETLSSELKPEIVYAERLKDEGGSVWKVVKREANPADFITRFWVVLVIDWVDK